MLTKEGVSILCNECEWCARNEWLSGNMRDDLERRNGEVRMSGAVVLLFGPLRWRCEVVRRCSAVLWSDKVVRCGYECEITQLLLR